MTQQLQVSIIAAPIAALDRRALSQAWYSALGCTSRSKTRLEVLARRGVNAQTRSQGDAMPVSVTHRGAADVPAGLVRSVRQAANPGGAETVTVSRQRQLRAALAERIEAAFCAARPFPKRSTFSMGRGSARIHIVLQTNGTSTILLALCRPELRAVVTRALAQARLALAARGFGVASASIEE
ncbi:MAG TPA: hypothetical protein VFF63_06605 [Candidatus Babeliales bacterium]|nr:hypothetical protein [Candidatus Babeliales bacterium]